jgi:hypothetical protein
MVSLLFNNLVYQVIIQPIVIKAFTLFQLNIWSTCAIIAPSVQPYWLVVSQHNQFEKDHSQHLIMSFWLLACILLWGISVHSSSEEVSPILSINSGAREDFVDEDGKIWLVRKASPFENARSNASNTVYLIALTFPFRRIDSSNLAMRTAQQNK